VNRRPHLSSPCPWGTLSPWARCSECWGHPEQGSPTMSIIPLHLQRRFERRWAARFGLPAIRPIPKNIGLEGSPPTLRGARQSERKSRRVEPVGLIPAPAV
jgi:hypothetical protein